MKGINKVTLIGNVGRDPEIRYQPSGAAVANFSLATTESWTKDGQANKRTEWHRLVAFGKLAEIVEKYVKSGSALYVEGKLQTRTWEDREGNKRYTTEINVRELQFLGRREDSQDFQKPQQQAEMPQDFDDDIPF